ncbi:hypothetical protein L9F63_021808, partial [Diploptera punctata]
HRKNSGKYYLLIVHTSLPQHSVLKYLNFVSVNRFVFNWPVSEDGGSPRGDRHQPFKPMCPECGRVYSTTSNLKQHIANVHAKADYWEPCHVCGKMFKTRQYLHTHLLQTHGIRQRRFKNFGGFSVSGAAVGSSPSSVRPPCPFCGRVYSSPMASLRCVWKEVQDKTLPHQSQTPGTWNPARRLFLDQTVFVFKMATGAGAGTGSVDGMSGPGRSFECPLCDAVVIELPAMRAHLEEHYPRDSPTCPVSSCAKAFSHPNSVRNHMRMKHAQQWDKMKTLKWSQVSRRGLDMMRVRATDPRPCPKCGKIYRSAHTLRTHLEDKHTVCPGYRCVLCGTVAKSRNSLHSHMSRQHRGISTKDLPVLPMPSPFDPDLASRLLAKAGVKVSAAELRARASPTGPRRPDVRLEVKSNHIGAPSEAGSSLYGGDDPEDLTIANSRFGPLSPPTPTVHNSAAVITKVGPKHHGGAITSSIKSIDSIAQSLVVGGGRMGDPNRGPPPPPPPPAPGGSTGSAILDTYLQFIAENSNSLALGLSGEQAAAHAAAAAAAAAHAAKAAVVAAAMNNDQDNCRRDERDDREDDDEDGIGDDRDRGADEVEEEMESSGGEEEDEYSEDEQEVVKAE